MTDSFATFTARDYLDHYYAKPDLEMVRSYVAQKTAGEETMRIMMFLGQVCSPLIRGVFGQNRATVLEIGGGPTLYQLFNIVEDVRSIHFTDFLEDNLNEVRLWKRSRKRAFNWRNYAKAALMIRRDTPEISEHAIDELEAELRKKLTRIEPCDIFQPGLGVTKDRYHLISTHFVAESATNDQEKWQQAMRHLYEKLTRHGLLFMSALRGADGWYQVGERRFPAVHLTEDDLREGLKAVGFETIQLSTLRTEDRSNNYDGFMFVVAQRR